MMGYPFITCAPLGPTGYVVGAPIHASMCILKAKPVIRLVVDLVLSHRPSFSYYGFLVLYFVVQAFYSLFFFTSSSLESSPFHLTLSSASAPCSQPPKPFGRPCLSKLPATRPRAVVLLYLVGGEERRRPAVEHRVLINGGIPGAVTIRRPRGIPEQVVLVCGYSVSVVL